MAIRSAHPALLAALAAASTLAALPAAADRPGPGRGGFGGAPRVQPYRAPGPQFHAPGPAVRIHAPGPAVRFHGPGAGNAPNLSRLICQMLMRLDASWPGKTSLGLDVAAGV